MQVAFPGWGIRIEAFDEDFSISRTVDTVGVKEVAWFCIEKLGVGHAVRLAVDHAGYGYEGTMS